MNLTINSQHELIGMGRLLGMEEEHLGRSLHIVIGDDSLLDKWIYLEFQTPDGHTITTEKLQVNEGVIDFPLPSSLMHQGYLKLQLVARDRTGVVWKSDVREFQVDPSLNASDQIDQDPVDFISQIQSTMDDLSAIQNQWDISETQRETAEALRVQAEANRKNHLSHLSARLSALESLVQGNLALQIANQGTAYQTTVPAKALQSPRITCLGGGHVTRDGRLYPTPVTKLTCTSANLLKVLGYSAHRVQKPTDTLYYNNSDGTSIDFVEAKTDPLFVEQEVNTDYTYHDKENGYFLLLFDVSKLDTTKIHTFSYDLLCHENPLSASTVHIYTGKGTLLSQKVMFLPGYSAHISVTIPPDAISADLPYFEIYCLGMTATYQNFMLMEGQGCDTTIYLPAGEVLETPIPQDILALKDYGWGMYPSLYNYVDFEAKRYVQRCATRIYIPGDESNALVKTDGVVTLYALPQAVYTDLSHILSDATTFKASGGGTLTFVNPENAPVPYTVTYQCRM